MTFFDRRQLLKSAAGAGIAAGLGSAISSPSQVLGASAPANRPSDYREEWDLSIQRGLQWVLNKQSRVGHWSDTNYPTAMAALAGTAMICSGSTTTQGPYAEAISRTVEFLFSKSRANGLIGDPQRDNRYTYGHGFSMLFLSQVLGEEEDDQRREELVEVLEKAVEFSVNAQTEAGGWGYVSAADGGDFDEGSTTITQVQGLRGCRNAGIAVPEECIEKAKAYIYDCMNDDGGISYSSRNKGSSRPAITAAALAALYNAGDYDSDNVPKMLDYSKGKLHQVGTVRSFGHWHYTYLYYAQVVYRQEREVWEPFRDKLYEKIVKEQATDGSWSGDISPIYVTSCNLIILQLDKAFLPIYQR